jgi:SHS family sialic acid transporter-like MFS transporter
MGGEWALGVALVMEAWPSTSRPLMAGLIGAAANLGFLLIAVVGLTIATFIKPSIRSLHAQALPDAMATAALNHQAWRLLLFLGAMPAALTLFIDLLRPGIGILEGVGRRTPKNHIGDIFKSGHRCSGAQSLRCSRP